MSYLAVTTLAALVLGAAHAHPKLSPVKPSIAEPGIDRTYDSPNEVGDPVGTPRGRLFVFLPGTNAVPADYEYIVEDALENGYNGIGLEYPNSPSVHDLCSNSHDAACPGTVRNEVITGDDPNPYVTVTPPDSIVGRLTSLLGYLAEHDPGGHWGYYLSGGAIDWSRVVVGGHSQGAGHAAYTGKLFRAAGLCDFDSPADTDPTKRTPTPAPWLSQINVTPPSLEFGVTNTLDQVAPYAVVSAAWNAIPIPAQNQLTVTVAGSSPNISHALTVADGATPLGRNGVPVYTPLWNQACFSF